MPSFHFYQKWLFWAFVFQAVFGLALAFQGLALLPYYSHSVNQVFWAQNEMPNEVVNFSHWICAVLGSTLASGATALAFVVYYPFAKREPWAWNCVVVSLLVWFPLDTWISASLSVWPNVLFNCGALLLMGPPLRFTRKAFK